MPDWLTTASTQSQFDDIADYSYDLNDNMNKDLNKSISSITYNYLNLPAIINVTGKGTITYSYDAAGNKLKKVSSDNTVSGKTILTTTEYIAGFVYESKQTTPANIPNDDYSNRLQFMGQEEGRIRALYNNATLPNNITGFAFDYMIKDHLGNVRMVLTDEVKQNTYPAATLEGTYDASTNSMVNYEKGFYKIDPTKIISETAIASWNTPTVESLANTRLYYNNNGNPPANINYPSGCAPVQTDGSSKLYKLNATTNRTGLEFMIKVMAGDKIDIFGKSYFLNTATINNSNSTPLDLAALMANLLLTPANAAAGKGITSAQLTTINTGQVPTSFFRGTNGETTTIPKAYINYIFLDEQFKFAGGNFSRVGSTGIVKDHWYTDATQLQNLAVPKNGYIFVYVSNESNLDVFFDNLQVIHKPGPILEETHYYPFGLTMAGISSKSAGVLPNKDKTFQGQKFDDDLGLNWVEFKWRNHDPQIGRFIEIDPLAEDYEYNSTYAFSENKVTSHIELEGLEAIPIEQVVEEAEAAVPIVEKYADNIAHGIGITVTAIGAWVSSNLDKIAVGMETLAKSGALNSSQSYPVTLDLYIKSGMSGAPKIPATVQAKSTSTIQQRADKLSQKQRPGMPVTRAGKQVTTERNKAKNNGDTKCDNCGVKTQPAKKHTTGVTPPGNEGHTDHIDPAANGGSGTPDNTQHLCRDCNLDKGATLPAPPQTPPPPTNQ